MSRLGIKTITKLVVGAEATPVTLLTPTTGSRVKVHAVQAGIQEDDKGGTVEVYFGVANDIDVVPANAIFRATVGYSKATGVIAASPAHMNWPNDSGPVGDLDEKIQCQCTELANYHVTLTYEEFEPAG